MLKTFIVQIVFIQGEQKINKHYNVCKNHVFCYIEMANVDNKILKYNCGKNSMRVYFVIYYDLEFIWCYKN